MISTTGALPKRHTIALAEFGFYAKKARLDEFEIYDHSLNLPRRKDDFMLTAKRRQTVDNWNHIESVQPRNAHALTRRLGPMATVAVEIPQ